MFSQTLWSVRLQRPPGWRHSRLLGDVGGSCVCVCVCQYLNEEAGICADLNILHQPSASPEQKDKSLHLSLLSSYLSLISDLL